MKIEYNYDFFNEDSEELYYFLGFIASDGYVSDNLITLELNKKDKNILEKFRLLICKNKDLAYRESTDSYRLSIYISEIAKRVKRFFKMKSNKKSFELEFPAISKKYLKDFIRGYVDGDGCIDFTFAKKRRKKIQRTTVKNIRKRIFLI